VIFSDLLIPVQQQITELTAIADKPVSDMTFEERSHLMVELCILSYFDAKSAEDWGHKIGFPRTTQCTPARDNSLSVTIFTNDTDIVLSFRGTHNVANFAQDIDYHFSPDHPLMGLVHKGFIRDFNKLWGVIIPVLDTKKQLWATGHSLGGALAGIACVKAARRVGPNVNGLMTFGQPRIGNIEYVADLSTPSHRYVNHIDVVPTLPPTWLKYAHFGKEVYINADGEVQAPTVTNRILRFFSYIVNMFRTEWNDHNIVNYREAIVRSTQESKNG
jgi:hypothetical protein